LQNLGQPEESYYRWFEELYEPWMRTLIADFIYTFKYQKIVIPYGPTGKMVDLPDFRATLVITAWDVTTSLDLSHSNQIHDVNGRTENYISFGKSRKASEDYNEYGTNGNAPLSNCKPDVGILSRKGRDSEVYVRCLNPLRIRTNAGENENQRHFGSKIESRKDADIAVGFGNCSNSGTISELQASYGIAQSWHHGKRYVDE